jgi:hypothetical protein
MKIRIKTQEDTYFLKLLSILNNIPPFNKLRPKELELYAQLLTLNHKYRNVPFQERNTLIFSYDSKVDIAKKMEIKLSGVYNNLSSLRSAGVIKDETLIPKYVLVKTPEVSFIFEEE